MASAGECMAKTLARYMQKRALYFYDSDGSVTIVMVMVEGKGGRVGGGLD